MGKCEKCGFDHEHFGNVVAVDVCLIGPDYMFQLVRGMVISHKEHFIQHLPELDELDEDEREHIEKALELFDLVLDEFIPTSLVGTDIDEFLESVDARMRFPYGMGLEEDGSD